MSVPIAKSAFDNPCANNANLIILIMHNALISANIYTNRIVFIYQCLKRSIEELLSIYCRYGITYCTLSCLELRGNS